MMMMKRSPQYFLSSSSPTSRARSFLQYPASHAHLNICIVRSHLRLPRLARASTNTHSSMAYLIKTDDGESEAHRELRRAAFFAIVISTAAVIASIVSLPLLYSYVANFQSQLILETDFCRTRSRDLWGEVSALHRNTNLPTLRLPRQSGYGSYGASQPQQTPPPPSNPPSSGGSGGYGSAPEPVPAPEQAPDDVGCCSCQQGPTGPAGEPGESCNHLYI